MARLGHAGGARARHGSVWRTAAWMAAATWCGTAAAWSPTDSYAPGNITCPSGNDSLVRAADSLSSSETEWIKNRHTVTDEYLVEFLDHANLTDFDAAEYLDGLNSSISIGVAFSGGGYRAMLAGAGQVSALDNNTVGAWEHGLGGLLQATTYIAGLSGGNWLMGTLVYNNWTSVQQILDDGQIWDLRESMFLPGGWDVVETVEYWDDIDDDLEAKRDAGFNISLTDPWGRALSHQFFPNVSGDGSAMTVSTLRDAPVFVNHQMPFPIHVTDGRTPGTTIISVNSTVFEVNPFELGSWDPSLYAFTDVKYLGTEVSNGYPVTDQCVAGFDNAGFIMGTSSTLFNQFLLQLNTTSISGFLYDLVEDFLDDLSSDSDDIAVYRPNPFLDTEFAEVDSITAADTLYLVDGGEDLQNVPLAPLLQPERGVDIIFAFDNSADTDESWPNGTSLTYTYERQFAAQGNGTVFPYVPDVNSFVNLNLTAKPAFFGCDSSNLTDLSDDGVIPPLVVYIANRPFSYWSNTSTYKMSYEDYERDGMIQNGFEVASRLNMTLDDEWRTCVACAIIRRSQERDGVDQSEQCASCFDEYCWDGSLDSSADVGINFTETGTTSGAEDTNNTSGAARLAIGGSSAGQYYAILAAMMLSTYVVLC